VALGAKAYAKERRIAWLKDTLPDVGAQHLHMVVAPKAVTDVLIRLAAD
jgi:hypothetical protein